MHPRLLLTVLALTGLCAVCQPRGLGAGGGPPSHESEGAPDSTAESRGAVGARARLVEREGRCWQW
jgi:hypothetical protein